MCISVQFSSVALVSPHLSAGSYVVIEDGSINKMSFAVQDSILAEQSVHDTMPKPNTVTPLDHISITSSWWRRFIAQYWALLWYKAGMQPQSPVPLNAAG